MRIPKKNLAPRYVREEGITSYLLASSLTSDAKHVTTTLVEIRAGARQQIHSHLPEQVYFILEGSGMMTVRDDRERVGPGDCIFIPSKAPHGLENDGDLILRYFSAASPSFERDELEKLWPLESESEKGDRS
ncbi:MAG: cupin domain-containing protein [Candidatus Zixiibacteriota bacterium]|nr:MAG: cupin domain-containing protein [candidate division Zixibacteria bacterium]